MSKDSDSKVKLGHGKLASSIVRRLERHYEKDADLGVENSLVVGIFGEWGSGKSTLLNEIGAQFERLSEGDLLSERSTVTVPVRFNPWRYEKESHLIVPLLKVTQATLKKHLGSIEKEEESFWQHLKLEGYVFSFSSLPSLSSDKEIARENKRNRIVSVLKKASRLFGISAISMTSMIKLKAGLPGVGSIEFSGKDMVNSAKSLMDMVDSRDKKGGKLAAIEALESHYYAFESGLKDITRPPSPGNAGKEKLNLLFLIDDLDRCLPEKAVEMLESIKLFLDVPGCAFAIALDDEVVERGIQHRYRDYIFEQYRNGNGNNGDHAPPITGAEYLEKIIQLPFRLPLPTEVQLKALLKSRYPELFADIQVKRRDRTFEHRKVQRDIYKPADEMFETKESPLLGFLVDVVPPVPRKLIRSAELIELTKSLAKERQVEHLNELALARYILLQLFAPQLYRYARNHYKRIFQKLKEWKEEFPDDWRRDDFDKELRKTLFAENNDDKSKRVFIEDITNADRSNFERNEVKILKMLFEVRNNRVGFDPADLLTIEDGYDDTLSTEKYFSLVDDDIPQWISLSADAFDGEAGAADVEVSTAKYYQEPFTGEIEIDDPEFIDQLFGRKESSWRSALARNELQDKQIASKTYEVILSRLNGEYGNFATNMEWLTAISSYLNFEQLQRIYKETSLLEKLQTKGINNEQRTS